jgi:hypothetical protein
MADLALEAPDRAVPDEPEPVSPLRPVTPDAPPEPDPMTAPQPAEPDPDPDDPEIPDAA